MANPLPFRARLTYCAHMFKALTRQHHAEMLPLFQQYAPADGIIIDVGAHAGQFTKLFSRLVPEGHVYSFEPGKYAYSIASRVFAFRRLKNVSLYPFGLGDQSCEKTLRVPIKKSGSVGFGLSHIGDTACAPDRAMREEIVYVTTLDQFIKTHAITRVDFIKVDIEGWEMRFLTGARQTIKKYKPVIFLEINSVFLKRGDNTSQQIWDFLTVLGYQMHAINPDQVTLTPLDGPIDNGDVWCAHKGR